MTNGSINSRSGRHCLRITQRQASFRAMHLPRRALSCTFARRCALHLVCAHFLLACLKMYFFVRPRARCHMQSDVRTSSKACLTLSCRHGAALFICCRVSGRTLAEHWQNTFRQTQHTRCKMCMAPCGVIAYSKWHRRAKRKQNEWLAFVPGTTFTICAAAHDTHCLVVASENWRRFSPHATRP